MKVCITTSGGLFLSLRKRHTCSAARGCNIFFVVHLFGVGSESLYHCEHRKDGTARYMLHLQPVHSSVVLAAVGSYEENIVLLPSQTNEGPPLPNTTFQITPQIHVFSGRRDVRGDNEQIASSHDTQRSFRPTYPPRYTKTQSNGCAALALCKVRPPSMETTQE